MADDELPRKRSSHFFARGKSKLTDISGAPGSSSQSSRPSFATTSSSFNYSPLGSSFESTASGATKATSFEGTPVKCQNVKGQSRSHSVGGAVASAASMSLTGSSRDSLSIRENRRKAVYGPEDLSNSIEGARALEALRSPSLVAGSPFSTHLEGSRTHGSSHLFQGQVHNRHSQQRLNRFLENQSNSQVQPHLPNLHLLTSGSPVVQPLSGGTTTLNHDSGPAVSNSNTMSRPLQRKPFTSTSTSSQVPNQTVDLDRDPITGELILVSPAALGRRILRPVRPISMKGVTTLPHHVPRAPWTSSNDGFAPVRLPYATPPHLYTSPNRIPHAIYASRKRKRTLLPILPPPAFIYNRSNSPDFNIFDGILLYPELCLHLASVLSVADLESLYSISRDFHTIIDTRFTTVMLSQAEGKVPESADAFPFRCYRHLCRRDPAARIPHPDPVKAAEGEPRWIPSFRWLKMVMYREKVVHEIMAIMAEDGVPVPKRCLTALRRMWFMLDIPDNARRIGYTHNCKLLTDVDLYFCIVFFVKLDMRFTDPLTSEVRFGLRKMLLSQPSLGVMAAVLRRDIWRNQFELMQAYTRLRGDVHLGEIEASVFGVPPAEIGKLRWEYWGRHTKEAPSQTVAPQCLLRPDQLVMREACRRGLRMRKHFFRCVLYGYVRPDTLENYAPRDYGRRIESLEDDYGVDDDLGAWEVPAEDERDDILDLGQRKIVSKLCIRPLKKLSKEQKEKRQTEDKLLQALKNLSMQERRRIMKAAEAAQPEAMGTN